MEELKSVALALVAGARYGTKVRLPHATLMTFLFKRNMSSRQKLQLILRMVKEHASNLAIFAGIYKSLLALLKWKSRRIRREGSSKEDKSIVFKLWQTVLSMIVDGPLFPGEAPLVDTLAPPGHPERSHHALVAGFVGGYLVWGRYSSVNYQIVLYLASRVLVGLWKRYGLGHEHKQLYKLSAAVVWGIVMMLFEECPEVLHPSLKSSMDEIYRYGLPSPSSTRDSPAGQEIVYENGSKAG